ncbi:MAG: AAA family ATPase [Bacteroidota bacterium]
MKLPIGIQTFSKIRDRDMVYVDKTQEIWNMLESARYLFLSRPRRFGKSLLVSILKELHEGNRSLFEGLWIEPYWDWSRNHPVIHLQFSKIDYQAKGLGAALVEELQENAKRLGVELKPDSAKSSFRYLIEKASVLGKVVVLVDEYDKPIIDYLDDLEQAKAHRQILKNLYSVLKDSDPYLELVFITGVSRFAKTGIFSDLNNIVNLSLDRYARTLLGITSSEIDTYFHNRIEEIAELKDTTVDEVKTQMKFWYNGYSWGGAERVYNPFSLLNFMRNAEFNNYWYETGTPSFLINLMRENHQYKIEDLAVPDTTLSGYALENLNPTTILFQTGYLTIKERINLGVYLLGYPNQEVKVSLESHLLDAFSYDHTQTSKVKALRIATALQTGDLEPAINTINATFANIPNQLWQKENEAFYHALIHLTFSLAGAFIQSEVNHSTGRLDAKIETEDTIYILEFKLDQSAEIALAQIGNKKYFQPYEDSPKQKIGVGVNFSTETKTVTAYKTQLF